MLNTISFVFIICHIRFDLRTAVETVFVDLSQSLGKGSTEDL